MKTEKQNLSPIINGKVIQPPPWRLVLDICVSASPAMSLNQVESFYLFLFVCYKWPEMLEDIHKQ